MTVLNTTFDRLSFLAVLGFIGYLFLPLLA